MPTSEIRESFLRLKSQMIEQRLGPVKFKILLYFIEKELPIPKIAQALTLRPYEVVMMTKIVAKTGLRVLPEIRDMIPQSPVRLLRFTPKEEMKKQSA